MKETALITGRNGFIGSHLANTLEKRGIKVIGVPRELLTNLDELKAFVYKHKPQYIFHLAAYGNHSMQHDESTTVITNYIGTWFMLQATREVDYKAFVNFSTSSVYGWKYEAMKETDVLEPTTFYSATKAGIEYLAMAYKFQYHKPIINIRPFSVYGPGEADWRLIPTICKSLVTGKSMRFVKYPEHDWIYIDDFIKGVLIAAEHAKTITTEPLNIGTGKSETNEEILKSLSYISDKEIKTDDEEYAEMTHHSSAWKANNSQLKSLGWKQEVEIGEGLRRCWEYYSKKYEKQRP